MRSTGTASAGRRPIFVMVGVGIFLFIAGFMLAVSSLEASETGSNDTVFESSSTTSTSDAYLLAGLLLSLAGVVSATAGPAAFFIHRKRSA